MAVEYDVLSQNDEVFRYIGTIVEEEFPVIRGLTTALAIKAVKVRHEKRGMPALKKGGVPKCGLIDVVAEKNRTTEGPDVLIQLDAADWEEMSHEDRLGLISSLLRSLDFGGVLMGQEGAWQPLLDSLDRPKVRILPPDFEVSGYFETIAIHGDSSPEKSGLNGLNETLRQKRFDFDKKVAS
jgi:Putative phage metallopeptidase